MISNQSSASRPRQVAWWTTGPLAGMLTALAVIAVAQLADPDNGGGGYMRVAFLVSLLLVAMSASRFVKGGVTRRQSPAHDEFERAIMTRSAARAYIAMLGLLAVVFGWLALAGLTGRLAPQSASAWTTLGLAVLGIGVGLPVLFAECSSPTMPDAADEEEA